MNLPDYFNSLSDRSPQSDLTHQIQTECRVSYITAYRWLRGKTPPPPVCRKIIADIIGMAENELFNE